MGNKKDISLKANVVMNMIYQVFLIILPFITGPYTSRILHADGVGTESYVSSLMTYFSMFAVLGTSAYGVYSIARHRDDKKQLTIDFWEIETLSLITSGLMIICWIIFACAYKEYTILMLIQTLNLVGTALSINWFYAGLEKFQYDICVSTIVRVLGVICIFVFVKEPGDLWKLILINGSSVFLGELSLWMFLPKFVGKFEVDFKNIFTTRLKETSIYFIPSIATSIYTAIDKSLIGIITNDAFQNGYYEQATKIINMAKTLSFSAIHGVVISRASYYFRNDEETKARELAIKNYSIISFLTIGVSFGIAVIAKDFVPFFFGDGYEPTIYLLYIMAIVIPVIGLSNALGSIYYTPSGRRMQSTWYLIAGSVANLILNICLIPTLGSYGAAIATVMAETLITVLYIYNARNFISFKKIFKIYYKKIIAGIVMLILCTLLDNLLVNLNVILALAILILSGVIIYVGVLLLLKDKSVYDVLEFVKEKLRRK